MRALERLESLRSQIAVDRGGSVRCSECETPAVIDQPYRGAHLCGAHFDRTVERRFDRALHRQWPRPSAGTLAVALSGGKDSTVALALTHRALALRPGIRLVAITVDEGIGEYRPRTIEAATRLTAQLGVDHRIVRATDELGTTTDAAALRLSGIPPCSFCGVWRRRLLNDAAARAGAAALVLGFNLDDLAQTVLMNVARGDLAQVARSAPHATARPGLISRLAPLADVPEREVYLYARRHGLPFDHGECPHASRAARNRFREIVWALEEAAPGTRQSLLRTRDAIVDLWPTDATAVGRCRACGGPANGDLCRGCAFLAAAPALAEAT